MPTSSLPLRLFLASFLVFACAAAHAEDVGRPPNFVVIFADDMGYGDVACFGHPTIRTPNLDRMAREGQRWSSFYVAASVCTPSRAGLMTGRLPIRTGMCSTRHRVLFPNSVGGLPAAEVTIAETLKEAGYATACFGKWHLGHLPEHLPTSHGFDTYHGIPYSNDMDFVGKEKAGGLTHRQALNQPQSRYWNAPLLEGTELVERGPDQAKLTQAYTDRAVAFIREHSEAPFFVYLPHSLPHVPLFAGEAFRGKSRRGLYGDVIEDIDHGVGRILLVLEELNLADDTLVIFTSDNGPWLPYGLHGGSAGLLRDGKGSTWEGGMRVPCVMWWPGRIRPQVVRDPGSTLDLLPTLRSLAGIEPEADLLLDGFDLSATLLEGKPSPRDHMLFYRGVEVFACREGAFKAHFKTRSGYGGKQATEHDPPLLFDLERDPGERHNVAQQHPALIASIRKRVARHHDSIVPVTNQLERQP